MPQAFSKASFVCPDNPKQSIRHKCMNYCEKDHIYMDRHTCGAVKRGGGHTSGTINYGPNPSFEGAKTRPLAVAEQERP